MASGSFSKKTKGYTVKTEWSSTTSVANNSSTITCTHYLIADGGWGLSIGTRTLTCTVESDTKSFTASSISTSGGTTHKLGTTTHTITHNSDGTKSVSATTVFPLNAKISGENIGNITATGTMKLDDIPRASSLTASNGTLNTAQTLTINRASDSFSHTITYKCGSASGTIATKTTSTSVSWTPPLSLASQNTTGTSVSITFTTTTYNYNTGDTIGTSTKTISCTIPDSVKPTCNVSISDSTGHATTYGGYIQGISKFKVTVSGTTSYGSAISSYRTTANGSTYTSKSFTTGVIINSGTATITGRVTDKRGRSGTKSVTATVLAYNKPQISKLTVNRCNSDGTENMQGEYVKVTYSCSISSLNSKNTLSSIVKYKKTSDTTYTSQTDVNAVTTSSYTNRSVIIPAESGSSYDIELSITDKFGTTAKTTSVSTAFTFHHYKGPNIEGEGKNLYDCVNNSFSGYQYSDDGTYAANGNWKSTAKYIAVTPNEQYTISGESASGWNFYLIGFDSEYNFVSRTAFTPANNKNGYTLTIPETVHYLKLQAHTTQFDPNLIQLEKGSKATDYEPYIHEYEASMGLGKLAELEGGLDIGFKTRFNAGFEFPVLKAETDLNDVKTPNFYVGNNISTYNYTNCPLTSGTFYLNVVAMGSEGQAKQTITSCSKTDSVTYERYYYEGAWGDWTNCLLNEKVLFYNESNGPNALITLKESVDNFKYIDIYFADNNISTSTGRGYTRIYADKVTINGTTSGIKRIDLSLIEASTSPVTYIRRTRFQIGSTTMSPSAVANSGYVKVSDGTVTTTTYTKDGGDPGYIRITKVIGIR